MDNPIDFVDPPRWKSESKALAIVTELETLGFRPTRECFDLPNPPIRALGLLHEDGLRFAIAYEGDAGQVWCEVGIEESRSRLCVVTSSEVVREWETEGKRLILLPGAPAIALLGALASQDHTPRPVEPAVFAMVVHSRLLQHWSYQHGTPPEEVERARRDRARLSQAWVQEFVTFFRQLGFLSSAEDRTSEELTRVLLNYDEPLFVLFPGVTAVVDDYDDFQSLFTSSEVESWPLPSLGTDLKLLALLDPGRVWWEYRSWFQPDDLFAGEDRTGIASLVEGLGRISQGYFQPTDVAVRPAEDGSFDVSFRLGSGTHAMRAWEEQCPAIFDPGQMVTLPSLSLVREINGLIAGSGHRFVVVDLRSAEPGEESAFRCSYILLSSDQELDALTEGRGWTLNDAR